MNITDNQIEFKRLSQDVEYYNNVFKKVEKISSVVFYILSFKKDVSDKSVLKKSLEEKSFKAHELSLASLETLSKERTGLYELQQSLVSLMSTLQVAAAAREIPEDMSLVIIEQIDAVQRYLSNHYLGTEALSMEDLYKVAIGDTTAPKQVAAKAASPKGPSQKRQQRVVVPSGDISTDAYLVYSQLNDRSQRIKTVLEAKPQATVKDISEIITDVSEKTIQRDLNSLIEKGQVAREGERRWSKYSVVKD